MREGRQGCRKGNGGAGRNQGDGVREGIREMGVREGIMETGMWEGIRETRAQEGIRGVREGTREPGGAGRDRVNISTAGSDHVTPPEGSWRSRSTRFVFSGRRVMVITFREVQRAEMERHKDGGA